MSSLEVAENSDLGTVVGVFDTVDVDAGQSNTYKLVNNSDNIFSINNNKLQVNFYLIIKFKLILIQP